MADKLQAVEDAAVSSDNLFIVRAMDFAVACHDEIGDDAELDLLMERAARLIDLKVLPPDKRDTASQCLGRAFTDFSSREVRLAVLDRISTSLTPDAVELVNAFVAGRAQEEADNPEKDTMDALVEKSLHILKEGGNRVSFNILFIADLMGVWSGYRELLEDSFAPLASGAENEILKIADSAGVAQRMKILDIIGSNEKISKKIKGNVAEKLLLEEINSARDNRGVFSSKEDALLYVQSVSLAAECHWTRCAQSIADSFSIASKSYGWGLLDADSFCTLIADMVRVSCPDTGRFLSQYLGSLNKDMESGGDPEEAVVLSVIKALGGLGDKAAFDYLLYATYLDYPSDVTDAARLALAKLKW
ncbi:MAG: hypothetical protein K6G18_06735 [Treponema sp.]|nr:hypothetical protein [Treponema sp.]MCR5621534.1 hypothetical protein [Treponema sp.]